MNSLLLVVLVLVTLFVLMYLRPRSSRRAPETSQARDYAYARRSYLLSKAERSFYETLRTAVGDDYHVFPQVHLPSVICVAKGSANRQSHWNRIQSKCIDFVLCDTQWVSPVLAIELDDASHQDERRHERDGFLDTAFEAAGIPLLHVRAAASYSVQQLREQVRSAAKITT